MRTTVTLDEDVAAKLKAEMRRSGGSLEETINEVLRRGLPPGDRLQPRGPFRIQARDLGALRPGSSLEDVAGLLDRIEGERHR
jgi:hypothetical protein